jgi:peptide/nickel transport system substrate-binding protein
MMRRLPNHRRFLAVGAACLLAAGIAACSSSKSSSGASSSSSSPAASSSGATLVMESSPESTITQDFNPYVITQAVYGMGADGLIYEPLIEFDLASPPTYYPWLATGYTWSNGGKASTFAIRQGVKWNNGTPFTPADVAFTFNLIKANTSINLGGIQISSVSTSGNNVTLTFATPQYANLEEIAGTAILPQAVWSKAGNPANFTDSTPVGTGPYMLQSFTPQGFTLDKNPYYWQASEVHVPKVYFPVYTSNTGALTALFSNQIDWTGNFIPGLQKSFVDTSPSTHHYWEAPGSTNALFPNLTKWPTDQLPVRQAISDAINRTLIADEGEAGLESPVTTQSGLTLPTFSAWQSSSVSGTNSAASDPSAAEQVLQSAGYTKNSSGFFEKNGQVVSLTIVDPAAYTDYAEDDELVAQELKSAGIDATFDGLSVDAWNSDVADGDFQLTMHWANGGITPYNMYDNWLDSSLSSGSNATAATGDYERLNDPTINADLAKLAGDETTATQTTDLVPLEQYVAANLPIIPTTTASDWFEYNSKDYTGWPTQANPYESGQPSGSNNGPGSGTDLVVILHLTPAS